MRTDLVPWPPSSSQAAGQGRAQTAYPNEWIAKPVPPPVRAIHRSAARPNSILAHRAGPPSNSALEVDHV